MGLGGQGYDGDVHDPACLATAAALMYRKPCPRQKSRAGSAFAEPARSVSVVRHREGCHSHTDAVRLEIAGGCSGPPACLCVRTLVLKCQDTRPPRQPVVRATGVGVFALV